MPTGRCGRVGPGSGCVGYLIAAYVVVVGSLLAYGLWIQAQRRALRRRDEQRRAQGPSAPRRA